jgi:hypothetical protein
MNQKDLFLELFSKIQREGTADLLAWLENSDFYTAPASTKYHGAYEGGLLEHSLNVYAELQKLKTVYPEIDCSEESLIIVSLFHDLCKVNSYVVEKRFRKDDAGKWEQYDAYVSNEKLHYGGHGSKSVFILQNFIKLTVEEAVAINCHMGSWEDVNNNALAAAYEQCPMAWLLHVADEAATFVKEANY